MNLPGRFSVALSGAQRETLMKEDRWAKQHGLGVDYRAALREIDYRLTFEADEWGENREFLETLNLQMRCGTSRMITVIFGVDETRRIVFVREFRINRKYHA